MKKRNIIFVLLLLVGILSIILSVVCFGKMVGGMEYNQTYGGDAYTGIQHAAAQTARNVMWGNEILAFGFGSILLIAGLSIVIFSIYGFISSSEIEKIATNTDKMANLAYSTDQKPMEEELPDF